MAMVDYEREGMHNASTAVSPVVPIVSYYVFSILAAALGTVVTTSVALIGIVSNIANILVYYKMGLQETTNINFFTLAINDLISSVSVIFVKITSSPLVNVNVPRPGALILQISYVASALVYSTCGFGAYVTALLSTERCFCIVMPLKVKTIITARRIAFLISAMAAYELSFFTVFLINTGPPYGVRRPKTPIYILGMYTVPSILCFGIVFISTLFLIIRLKQTVKWRSSAVNQTNTESSKETRVARSVVYICSIFITCFLPNVATDIARVSFKSLSLLNPKLRWLLSIIFIFNFLLQTMNSSLNIFVYYSMSSRYRQVFKELFFPSSRRVTKT